MTDARDAIAEELADVAFERMQVTKLIKGTGVFWIVVNGETFTVRVSRSRKQEMKDE